jgi:DNA-binding NarL/FixJ family response regulator
MKLLIVDDSKMLQSRLKDAILKIDKHVEITQALNCKQALKEFSVVKPNTVVLDIALPDGSGIGLLRLFKKENPNVKVIMFTNYPTIEFKDSCMKLGADHFLDKSRVSNLINYILFFKTILLFGVL